MDSSQRCELTDGYYHRSHGGFELTLAPLLMALLGLWLDRTIDTVPVFTISLAVIGFLGVFVKLYYVYRHDMARTAPAPAHDTAPADDTAPAHDVDAQSRVTA